jgi:hypothetical protein
VSCVFRVVLGLEISDFVVSFFFCFTAGAIRTGNEALVIDTEGKEFFYNPANHGAEERLPPPTATATETAAQAEAATEEGEPDMSLINVPPELLASAIQAIQGGAFSCSFSVESSS